jgi:hypothetical protein
MKRGPTFNVRIADSCDRETRRHLGTGEEQIFGTGKGGKGKPIRKGKSEDTWERGERAHLEYPRKAGERKEPSEVDPELNPDQVARKCLPLVVDHRLYTPKEHVNMLDATHLRCHNHMAYTPVNACAHARTHTHTHTHNKKTNKCACEHTCTLDTHKCK